MCVCVCIYIYIYIFLVYRRIYFRIFFMWKNSVHFQQPSDNFRILFGKKHNFFQLFHRTFFLPHAPNIVVLFAGRNTKIEYLQFNFVERSILFGKFVFRFARGKCL